MKELIVGIEDKLLDKWLEGKEYMTVSDEAEAVAIGAGHYLATTQPATVFMSADGFMNALNFLTSFVIPEQIHMNFVISYGRTEAPHYVASELLPDLIEKLKSYESERIHYELIKKES